MRKLSFLCVFGILLIYITPIIAQKSLKKGTTEFSFNLYQKICAKEESNIFFSPLSLSTSFAIPYTGAKNITQTQLKAIFNYDSDKAKNLENYKALMDRLESDNDEATKFMIANNLWLNEDFAVKPTFQQLMRNEYDTDYQHVNFVKGKVQAVQSINNWVAENTENTIRELLTPRDINGSTRFIITNALYFKGNWDMKFDEELTASHDFYLGNKDKFVTTPFMTKKMSGHKYYEDESVQVVELPYQNGKFSMIVVLPREIGNLDNVEQQLSYKTYKKWLNKMNKQPVSIHLPKFQLTQKYKMRRYFRNMNCDVPFMDKADFSNMTAEDVKLSEVIQKAYINVDESGTEASAATAIIGVPKGLNYTPKYFKANHPFLFFIKENKRDIILFMGRMSQPQIKELQNYTNEQPYRDDYQFTDLKGEDKHTVEKGETLFKIARMYRTHVSKLKRLNKLRNNNLEVGQVLWVRRPNKKHQSLGSDLSNNTVSNEHKPASNKTIHIVEKGETLFRIARKHKTSVGAIKALNQLEGNTIEIGQQLVIRHRLVGQHKGISSFRSRKRETVALLQEPEEKTPIEIILNKEEEVNPAPVVINEDAQQVQCNCKKHIVRKGETLYRLAAQYDTTVAQIKFINQLDSNTLEVGQKLMIENADD